MDIDAKYLLGISLICVVLAGFALADGGSDVTPANETMSLETTVNDTGFSFYVPENDTVSIKMTGQGERKEIPFGEFACREASSHAVGEVDELIRDRLDVDDSNYATGVGRDSIDVRYYSGLTVSETALERALPERLVVSIRVFEKDHQCSIPVVITSGGSPPEPL